MAKEKIGGQKAARRKQRKKKGGITARRKKEFTYRGFTMEEMLEMPFDEMVTLLPSRARRTLARGMNEEQNRLRVLVRNREVPHPPQDVPIIPSSWEKGSPFTTGRSSWSSRSSPR